MIISLQLWLAGFVALTITLIALTYFYSQYKFKYWEKCGVNFMTPEFPFGNCGEFFLFRKSLAEVYVNIYNHFEGSKYGGFFQQQRPVLMIRDLELIKHILVKDFACFQHRGLYLDEENDPIQKHLFVMGGPTWRPMRAKLTPTFTSGKMKMMFQIVLDCGNEFNDCMASFAENEEIVEIQDFLARYTTDVIASCAFGIQANCMKNPDSEFLKHGKGFFQRNFLGQIGLMMLQNAHSLAAITKLGNTPKAVAEFFIKVVKETVEYREKNNVTRNDFMQLLIQLKNKGCLDGDTPSDTTDPSKRIDMLDIAAQAFIFFAAGFETSSATMAFSLYELAVNPEMQIQLRQEIDEVLAKHDGHVTYEAMLEMEYLDKVIAETLRKYPAVSGLVRVCNTAYTIPDSTVVVEPGVKVVVPVCALHHDPVYYPEPHRFDPERFTKEEKAKRNPYTYLPFGEGPRNCIGLRFGSMMAKIGLISLLKTYVFQVSAKTVVPVVLDPKLFVAGSKGGIYLRILKRSDKINMHAF